MGSLLVPQFRQSVESALLWLVRPVDSKLMVPVFNVFVPTARGDSLGGGEPEFFHLAANRVLAGPVQPGHCLEGPDDFRPAIRRRTEPREDGNKNGGRRRTGNQAAPEPSPIANGGTGLTR